VTRGPIRVAVAGASGRMGRQLLEGIAADPGFVLAGAMDIPASPAIGQDALAFAGRSTGVVVSADPHLALAQAEVLIDFTRPEGTLQHLAACRKRGVRMVIGTTGFDAAQRAELEAAGQHLAIVWAPNMSVGVNLVLELLDQAARALPEGYDVEVIEAHHRHKVDAPSGTALAMGARVAAAWGKELADCAVYAREGVTGERESGTIGFATVRGGDIIGDHTVLFAGTGERIEITHKSASRTTYVQGSLRAARFVVHQAPGLYGMRDVLGLKPA
jgi:4-hydroxy-tetrahydrodipicolinate reductase